VTVFRNSYILAVLLHVIAFGALAFYTTRPTFVRKEATKPSAQTATAPRAEPGGFSAEKAPFPTAELAAKLTASLASAQAWTPPKQLDAAGKYADQLESISSVSSMKEMGAYLRSTVSWKPRESQAELGKEKVFDHATSTPVGARQVEDGSYVFVFRDANNNRFETPASAADLHAAKAMALLDRSEVLRELKESILLPMLNQRLDAP
jgi:hypothetical protein